MPQPVRGFCATSCQVFFQKLMRPPMLVISMLSLLRASLIPSFTRSCTSVDVATTVSRPRASTPRDSQRFQPDVANRKKATSATVSSR
ncbi:hypothetical protein D3C80_1661710 [compost metagenome]